MPNWCENDLQITGQEEDIQKFLARVIVRKGEAEEINFDFNKIIPYPEEFAGPDREFAKYKFDDPDRPAKDGFNSGGYEWCIENWGTKWNANDTTMDEMEVYVEGLVVVTIHFSTAWSPPIPIILAASGQYPDLTFDLRYFEQGCGFNGLFRVKNGEIEHDKTGEYYGNRGG